PELLAEPGHQPAEPGDPTTHAQLDHHAAKLGAQPLAGVVDLPQERLERAPNHRIVDAAVALERELGRLHVEPPGPLQLANQLPTAATHAAGGDRTGAPDRDQFGALVAEVDDQR